MGKRATGSCVDVDEACLKGLLHILCNILGPHGGWVINEATRMAGESLDGLTVPFHLVPVPNASVGNCGLPIRGRTWDKRGKTDPGSVV